MYLREYEIRKQSADTVLFPIGINGNESFVTANWETASLIESIGRKNSVAMRVFARLPGVAEKYYVRKCLIDEIQTTNDIEGVHSTRKEIREALAADDRKLARFKGMAKKYEKLLQDNNEISLHTCQDIRYLYDEIVSAEIDAKDQPDGMMFRKSTVFVVSPTQQKRHEGVHPEEAIIKAMEDALHILERQELPALVRIALFHYFFGYIHPFYDGNGRISRFISSYLLKGQYPLLSLDLSHTIKDNRKKYYEAFRLCNDRRDKGDLTPFVITFLEFLDTASGRMCDNLIEGEKRLEKLGRMAYENLFPQDRRRQKKIDFIYLLIQNALFASEPLSIEEMQAHAGISRQSVDNMIRELLLGGIPIEKTKSGKFNRFQLNLDEFQVRFEEG
jgi:Fic family protein